MSIADEILAFDDRKSIPVNAWGKELFLVPMSGTDRDAFDLENYQLRQKTGSMPNYTARYLVRCLVDAEGNRIFTDAQAESLGAKHSQTLDRLYKQAEGISQTGKLAVDAAVKN